jgi:Domain of unknown function (DUF3883)
MANGDWTRDEVEATVADYFAMLEQELLAEPYSKAEHNRQLQQHIGRSKGSIEFKHQNISAVLINFRQPFIRGYLPRQNYQALLEQVVLEWLVAHPKFFTGVADGPVLNPTDRPPVTRERPLSALFDDPPPGATDVDSAEISDRTARFYRLDFVRRDAENRRLGRMGEEFVLDVEQRRLHEKERRPDLARKVEWIANTRGDGAGYDIASFNGDGTARLIEVKTTGLGKDFPFMVTANEVRVSERQARAYSLYRVFDFSREPRIYTLRGPLSRSCRLEPTQFRAHVSGSHD